jgi:hypothetical protein
LEHFLEKIVSIHQTTLMLKAKILHVDKARDKCDIVEHTCFICFMTRSSSVLQWHQNANMSIVECSVFNCSEDVGSLPQLCISTSAPNAHLCVCNPSNKCPWVHERVALQRASNAGQFCLL